MNTSIISCLFSRFFNYCFYFFLSFIYSFLNT